jgi:hypothetical protein
MVFRRIAFKRFSATPLPDRRTRFPPAELLNQFGKAAEAEQGTTLKTALGNLGALTPAQARALFGEYVLPVREEVQQMLEKAGSSVQKFGKLLPQGVRDRLYDVGQNAAQAQKAVEDWYDSWMSQFSALYEAKIKVWSFWIGLSVVICLNANALHIFHNLYKSAALRASVLANSEALRAQFSPAESGGNTESVGDTEIKKQLEKVRYDSKTLTDLNVVGWKRAPKLPWDDSFWIGNKWRPPVMSNLLDILGWILTAFLVGVGAPFWHDLFDALLSVRMGREPKPAKDESTA